MDLNNHGTFSHIDPAGMLQEIEKLPVQLDEAWNLAGSYPKPSIDQLSHIIIAGMGGSAIGADMVAAYVSPFCDVPLTVLRGYDLPAWVAGPDKLIVCSSHSGNTEEVNSVFEQAIDKKCTVVGITRGGKLLHALEGNKLIGWKFEHQGQPRSAVGFSFGMLLNLLSRLQIIPDQSHEVAYTIETIKRYIEEIDAHIPLAQNLAKRIAGQAVNRHAVILGAEHLEPISRRWKTQLNELAKCWAQFEFIPEADHNTLAGLIYPETNIQNTYAVFMNSESYNLRNIKRMDLTFKEFMLAGMCTDKINFQKPNRLAEMWMMLVLGDFISYYLAMIYEVDPTPIDALEFFKKSMNEN